MSSWMLVGRPTERGWPEWGRHVEGDQRWWADLRELLKYRITDRFVRLYAQDVHNDAGSSFACADPLRERGCPWPRGLSVSADWIAVTTFRVATTLQRAGIGDHVGREGVFEVYPGAALAQWHLYKDAAGHRVADDGVTRSLSAAMTAGANAMSITLDLGNAVDASRRPLPVEDLRERADVSSKHEEHIARRSLLHKQSAKAR